MKTRAGLLVWGALSLAGLALVWQTAHPPAWVSWEEGQLPGTPELRVEDRTLTIWEGDALLWETEPGIQVQDVLREDLDRDGGEEILVLCWRRGTYGPNRPFWVKENPRHWSQHIFIYRWTGEEMKPLWMASELGRQVESWTFDPVRRLVLTDRQGRTTAWDWRDWGLTNIPLR